MEVTLMLLFIFVVTVLTNHGEKQANKGGDSTGVQVPVQKASEVTAQGLSSETAGVPTPNKENKKMSNNQDTIQFTVDLETFVRVALNDPKCREEVYSAVRKGPCEHTAKCGAANLGVEGSEDEWFTLFVGTDRRVEAGTPGFVFRNQRGDRISARLRRQTPKNQEAQTPGQLLPSATEGGMELLQRAIGGDVTAAQALINFAAVAETTKATSTPTEEAAPDTEEQPVVAGELPEL